MQQTLLSAQAVCKSFSGHVDPYLVLDHIDAEIRQGDFTVVMGSSGAGKSTFLYTLSGMDTVTSGKVIYKGQEISRFSEKQMAHLRATEFGFVFQQTHLVSNLTLYENIVVAGYVGGLEGRNEIERRADQWLTQLNVLGAKDRLPSQVSGGEAQRAAVARAMIIGPGLLFADEPTGALNRKNSDEVLSMLTALHENGQSILMVTHDVRAAIRGNRLLYMEDGKIRGELALSVFSLIEARDREAQVNSWLTSMEW